MIYNERLIVSTQILAFILIVQGCCNCDECFSPPEPFVFEIVDKSTGENLFTNGTYDPDQLQVVKASDNMHVEFSFNRENNVNLLQINSIGWETEAADLLIKVGNEIIFELIVDAERVSEDCCTFTRYHEIKIEQAEYNVEPTSGIYKIFKE